MFDREAQPLDFYVWAPEAPLPLPPRVPESAPVPKRARRRKAKPRKPNYGAKNTAASDRKQAAILALLDADGDGTLTIRDIATALGISRQLAHYHVRKLAYRREIAVMLEPSDAPGVLRFRLYTARALLRVGIAVRVAA
jgi:hypothetical protein